MPIVRDISQGLRFLHSAYPPVVHGDLKSKNILIDTKFRAKVRNVFRRHYFILSLDFLIDKFDAVDFLTYIFVF